MSDANQDNVLEKIIREDIAAIKKELSELHDFRIKLEAASEARKTIIGFVMRYWPAFVALVAVGVELKRMKP